MIFLANVNWCRPSVCRLSVTLVCPTQLIKIFDNVSTPFGTLNIPWHPWKILQTGEPFRLGGLNVRSNRLLSRLLMSLSCNVIQFFLIQSVISWWRVHCDKVTVWRVHCFSGSICDEFTVTSSLCDEFSVWRLHRVTSSLVALMADYCMGTRVRAWYWHGNPCWLSRYWCARVPVY